MRISRLRFAALAVLLVIAGAVAGSAWTGDDPASTHYVCDGGERFSVDYYGRHVHLRTGTGIVALPASAEEAGTRYSDGDTLFLLQNDTATLERPGMPPAADCRPQRRQS